MSTKVAVFVDGDNLRSQHAAAILATASAQGDVIAAKVYGNSQALANWSDCVDFQIIYSGTGKNASDLHLAIELTELTYLQNLDVVVLCTSDADFVHLARRLKERGIRVLGCGEDKVGAGFKAACSEFRELVGLAQKSSCPAPKPPQMTMNEQIRWVIARLSKNGTGALITELSIQMRHEFDVQIGKHAAGNWRRYLTEHSDLFDLDPKGPDAKVRFKPKGFKVRSVA